MEILSINFYTYLSKILENFSTIVKNIKENSQYKDLHLQIIIELERLAKLIQQ